MNRYFVLFFLLTFFKTEAQTSVLALADSLFAHGYYAKAIEAYKESENTPGVYEKRAKAYVAVGNYHEALINYRWSIEADSNNALLKYEYAKLLAKTKDFLAASNVFKSLIHTDSLNPNYHYEYGLTLVKQNDSLAIIQFETTIQLDSLHQNAIYKLAKYHLGKKQYQQVEKLVNIGLKTYESNLKLINLKAQNYYWQKHYEKASVWFEKLISLGESSQFIHEKLAFCYFKMKGYQDAVKQGLLALQFDPGHSKNLFRQGQFYETIYNYNEAETYYIKSLEIEDIPLDYQ